MQSAFRAMGLPQPCSYLPGRASRSEHEMVLEMSPAEYQARMEDGWRRFGRMLYRPRCPSCAECRSLRVVVDAFRPDRSMRRARARNAGAVALEIVPATGPTDPEVLDLYRRFHGHQQVHRGWQSHDDGGPDDFAFAFLDNPIPTQEWRYRLDGALVGVGYVDDLPGAFSAIYFVHDPEHRERSLGTWNVLCLIDRAAAEGRPLVYLGYYVEGCRSLRYKARFGPNQILEPGAGWVDGIEGVGQKSTANR